LFEERLLIVSCGNPTHIRIMPVLQTTKTGII